MAANHVSVLCLVQTEMLSGERRATATRLSEMADMFFSLTLIAAARHSPLEHFGANEALVFRCVASSALLGFDWLYALSVVNPFVVPSGKKLTGLAFFSQSNTQKNTQFTT